MLGRPARPVFDGGQIDRFPSPARSEGIYRASSFTMSAAFSAIIRVGELVLPKVMVGITEASAMRRPARPWTRRRASTTDPPLSPILQDESEAPTAELQSHMCNS